MPTCPTCGKECQSLGIARHRASHADQRRKHLGGEGRRFINGRNFHVCIEVEKGLMALRNAKLDAVPLFEGSREQAARDLIAAQKAGKKYHTGCDNEAPDGRCAGHDPKP